MGKLRSKKVKNNANYIVKEKEVIHKEKKDLISKHRLIDERNEEMEAGDYRNSKQKKDFPSEIETIRSHFCINAEITKIMAQSNFPDRFSLKFSSENVSKTDIVIQKNDEDVVTISKSKSKMTKQFVKFWNRFIAKQTLTNSRVDHQLTEFEAGYVSFQINSLLNLPQNCVSKPYCQKSRYFGEGHQFLPKKNQFSRISSWPLAKYEVQRIYEHFSNKANHFFLIPIEMSSKLSRCMFKSIQIFQKSQGCNKIEFECKYNSLENGNPLWSVEYKSTIEKENLPCHGMSLVQKSKVKNTTFSDIKKSILLKTCFNYPFLSHFLHRSDFWIDDFYARCWHYSRFFCNKLKLGNRINDTTDILVRDSFFNYLLACSSRICVAVKYWVLNPKGATYFRCWCGEKVFDEKQEVKILTKIPVGSANLFNLQRKVEENSDVYHRKHTEKKPYNHICVCNQQFQDHKLWISHLFSTKIYEISKICPLFIYMVARNCAQENYFKCECSSTFSDYDFWSFWLHTCGCAVLKKALKLQCECNNDTEVRTNMDQDKTLSSSIKVERRKRNLKRKRVSKSQGLKSVDYESTRRLSQDDEHEESGMLQEEEDRGIQDDSSAYVENMHTLQYENKLKNLEIMPKQVNFNNCNHDQARM